MPVTANELPFCFLLVRRVERATAASSFVSRNAKATHVFILALVEKRIRIGLASQLLSQRGCNHPITLSLSLFLVMSRYVASFLSPFLYCAISLMHVRATCLSLGPFCPPGSIDTYVSEKSALRLGLIIDTRPRPLLSPPSTCQQLLFLSSALPRGQTTNARLSGWNADYQRVLERF